MTSQELKEIIAHGENAKIDFKREWYKSASKNELNSEFIKDIFALTNGDKFSIDKTAYLIIGITDNTKNFYDFDTSKIPHSLERLKNELLNLLNNHAQPEFLALEVEWVEFEKGNEVLVLSIPPHGRLISLSRDLHGLDRRGTVYYRQGESVRVASVEVIKDFEKVFGEENDKENISIFHTNEKYEVTEKPLKDKLHIGLKALIFFIIFIFLTSLGYLVYKKYTANPKVMGENSDYLKDFVVGKRDENSTWSGWKRKKIFIKKTDTAVYFNLHYFARNAKLYNIRIGLSNFFNNLYSNKINKINYFFTADNAKPTFDSCQIISLDNIELILDKISWQENRCQSTQCESKLNSYNSKSVILNDLYSIGVNIGDVKENNYGNLVVKFLIKH